MVYYQMSLEQVEQDDGIVATAPMPRSLHADPKKLAPEKQPPEVRQKLARAALRGAVQEVNKVLNQRYAGHNQGWRNALNAAAIQEEFSTLLAAELDRKKGLSRELEPLIASWYTNGGRQKS